MAAARGAFLVISGKVAHEGTLADLLQKVAATRGDCDSAKGEHCEGIKGEVSVTVVILKNLKYSLNFQLYCMLRKVKS